MAGWQRQAGDILFCVYFLSSVLGIQVGATILHCDDVTTNSSGVCCLCYFPDQCNTNRTCPEGYQQSNTSTNSCRPGIDTSTKMTLTATDVAMVITTTENENQTDFNSSIAENEYKLCYNCASNEYFDGIQCTVCDSLCLSCTDAGKQNCDPCRFEIDNECVEQCPNGTHEEQNVNHEGVVCRNQTNTTVEPDNSKGFPVAIVAGPTAGGLALIFVVVVVVLVIRRRKKGGQTTGRSRMSEIIQDRNKVGEKKEETRQPSKIRHRDYENQPKPIATLPRDIENQSDNVLRYTKDPTANIQVGQTQNQSSSRDSGLYQNAAAIRVHTNFKNKRVSAEEMNEQMEKEEVENLPKAPPLPVVKKKRGIMERLSKKLTTTKTGSRTELVEADKEEYLDMEGVRANVLADSVEQPDGFEQEEYEDVEVGGQVGAIEHEEEDYENLQKKPKQSKLTNDKAKDIKREKKSYENEDLIKTLKKVDKSNVEDVGDTQELYENFNNMDPGHGTKAVGASELRESRGQGHGPSNEEETGVDITDEQLEDYENTATFKKNVVVLEPGRVESPYENVQFRKK